MAQRAEVIIYAISTNISGIKTRGDKVLERFAETTGGRVFFPTKLEEVAQAFSQIQDELRSQYALAYKPAEFVADGRYHTIAIESGRKGLRIRSPARILRAETVVVPLPRATARFWWSGRRRRITPSARNSPCAPARDSPAIWCGFPLCGTSRQAYGWPACSQCNTGCATRWKLLREPSSASGGWFRR